MITKIKYNLLPGDNMTKIKARLVDTNKVEYLQELADWTAQVALNEYYLNKMMGIESDVPKALAKLAWYLEQEYE